jgi:galactose mutarotase-like enzyme
VIKNLASRKITLKSDLVAGSVTVAYPHFDYLGLWAKPGAPFVCIEPWLGCADTEGKPVPLPQKEAIQHVDHGHVFETEFYISIEG